MNDEHASTADPFGQIADEFVDAFRRGERPSVEEYARRYPALADEIREILPALVLMEKAKAADDPSDHKASAAVPLQQLGDYQILREVGRGGMGVVYEAQQVSLRRHVAIKVLPAHALLDARQLGRFEREARSAAKLHHTNIVPVFGVGEQDGLHYYVMQFIQGLGLDLVQDELRRLRQPNGQQTSTRGDTPGRSRKATRAVSAVDVARGLLTAEFRRADVHTSRPKEVAEPTEPAAPASIPAASTSATLCLPGQTDASTLSKSDNQYWRSVARIGVQVADALAYAASQGILHRDIKPSNLLLDETGNVWVTDFGLAKADTDGDNLTNTGDIVGTLRYMAPERFNGQGDLRSDVYSLGLTLYELLTLQPAFDETDRNKLVKQVMHDEPVQPRKLNRDVPRDLETVVLKAIARDPAHRYQTPAEMAEDLKRFVEDRPVQARRISSVERLARWGRRNPLAAGSLTGVVAVFLTAFVLVSWSYFRAEDARQEEANQRQKAQTREKAERWERYRANLIAAGSAMQLHNVSAARAALDAAPEEHRNWEWKYFYHQLDTAHTVIGVGAEVEGIVLSADGTMAAVRYRKMPAQLWSLKTRTVLLSLPDHGAVMNFAFSADGKTLAFTVADNNSIYLWDIAAGRERLVLSGPENRVVKCQFSPNGTRLVAGSEDRTVRVWDTATGKQLLVLSGHEDKVHNAVFSADGRRILSVGFHDGAARLWDAETGQSLAILSGHQGEVANAIFNPQGDRVLSVELYPSNALRLWDATTGKLLAVLRGHTNGAGEIAFSPDGTRIASGSLDWTVRLWDGRTGQPLAKLDGHRGHIREVAFSADGKLLISASADRTARLWDAKTGAALGVLTGHTGDYSGAQFTPDGRTIVTASSTDGTVRLWDAHLAEQNRFLRGHTSFVYDVAFHPDGERVASAAWDGTVRIWEATTGRAVSLLHDLSTLPTEEKILSGIAFHPDGKLAATVGRKDGVRLWELTTGKQLHYFASPSFYDSQLTFSTRGDLLVSGTAQEVNVWDVKRRAPVAVLRGEGAHAAAFNPDDTWLATGGPRDLHIWDLVKQTPMQVLQGHTDIVRDVTVSRDGKWLASASMDGTARLWDTNTWKEAAVLKHGTNVYGVAFSPDGTRLACACGNGMIRLWDMKTHQFVAELEGHADYVHKVAFSPDGTRLVSGSGDKTVRIWDSLSAQERARRWPPATP